LPGGFNLEAIRFTGTGLCRPECVLAHSSGLLIAPDWTGPGGISLIDPEGRVERVLVAAPGEGVDLPVRPNGIALEDGGSVLLAHLGAERGGIYRLWPDGRCEVVTDRIGGAPMPPANFVALDRDGRIWITVSTTLAPRARDYRLDAGSGFIAVHDRGETRIVAEGLGYTNECLFSHDGGTLWVVETFARRLSAFDVSGAELSNRRVVAGFGPGDFPDGMAEAADGSLFLTSIVSNRILRISPEGAVERLLEDVDKDHLAEVEAAFQEGRMGRPHLDAAGSRHLENASNIAFGGPDLRTAYVGSLLGAQIAVFDSPVPGRELPHWNYDLGALGVLMGVAG
jgi:sugar lactone lactonase YvrE